MALTNNPPVNFPALFDANFIVSVALPATATTVNTNALSLGPNVYFTNGALDTSRTPFPLSDKFEVQLSTTASAGTANSKNCNVVLQHAGPNSDGTVNASNWANIPELANPVLRVTDSSGNMAAGTANVMLPRSVKPYIRAQAVLEANGGNAADATLSLKLAF